MLRHAKMDGKDAEESYAYLRDEGLKNLWAQVLEFRHFLQWRIMDL
jgi:hypothetical protein